MDFRIEHRVGVRADAQVIWGLIGDLSTWSDWNPVETEAGGAVAFGGAITLTERIPDLPDRVVQARVSTWTPLSQLVWTEKRGWQFAAMRYYEIEELEPGSCIVANGIIMSGLRGEGFHGKHKRTIKAAYERINQAIKAQVET